MNITEVLKAGIEQLGLELIVALREDNTLLILDLGERLANIKDEYTKVLELLKQDSRTTTRTYTASNEIDSTLSSIIKSDIGNSQVVHTKPYSSLLGLLNKAR